MTTIRSFIAIELPDEARDRLIELQSQLKDVVPPNIVRWTGPQNLHLTLHFLGDVAAIDLEKITVALKGVTAACPSLSLELAGLGSFPNIWRPRVVWVGVAGELESLVKLHQDLGEHLKQAIGFRPESRPYAPHLTIGRVKKGIPPRRLTQLGQALDQEQAGVGELATFEVKEISLMKSDLRPSGPIYTTLAQGELGD